MISLRFQSSRFLSKHLFISFSSIHVAIAHKLSSCLTLFLFLSSYLIPSTLVQDNTGNIYNDVDDEDANSSWFKSCLAVFKEKIKGVSQSLLIKDTKVKLSSQLTFA